MVKMIGLLMRGTMGGGESGCGMIVMPIIAVLALCGIWKLCCRCKLRSCGCIKRFLRWTGTDPFDDFDMMIQIHQVTFTTQDKKTTLVRVRAGDNVVETDPDTNIGKGLFQQTVNLDVEQGTENIEFELCDNRKKVLAKHKMNIMKDVLVDGEIKKVEEKVFLMKQQDKKVISPKITLTFCPETMRDEEKAILEGLGASAETEWQLTQQIQRAQEEADAKAASKPGGAPAAVAEPLSELDLLAKACAGPLEMFKKSGANDSVHVAVVGPPIKKKYALRIFDNEQKFMDGKECQEEIELLKILAVSPDPSRPEVFAVDFYDETKSKRTKKFTRVDRGRDVWVEMLQLLLTKVHADRRAKAKAKK